MKEGYVLVLFILGIFLVFTVSGQITGNPIKLMGYKLYTKADIDSMMTKVATKESVLNMLNKYEEIHNEFDPDSVGSTSCDSICSKVGKICIGAGYATSTTQRAGSWYTRTLSDFTFAKCSANLYPSKGTYLYVTCKCIKS